MTIISILSGQTMQTQITLFIQQLWSGLTLFTSPSASFGYITEWYKQHSNFIKNSSHYFGCQVFFAFSCTFHQTENLSWAAPSEFGTYRLCEQRRFWRACASAQSRHNLRCSLIQAVSQEEPSDRKPDPWLLWMAGHAQLKFVMTECSKTQIRLTRPK